MSNKDLINKIIEGTQAQTITIPYDNEDYTFKVRALTDGELNKLQEMENKPLTVSIALAENIKNSKNNAKVNNADLIKAQHNVKIQATAWGLSVTGEPPVKPEQVEALPKGLPNLIFQEIIKLSEITDEDLKLIKKFR